MATPSTDPTAGWQDLLTHGLSTSSSNQTPQPNVNPQGQLDIYGIGENSGYKFTVGTRTDTPSGMDQGDVGRGPTSRLHATNGVDVTTTPDDYITAMMHLSQSDPGRFMAFQQNLYAAGYYGNVTPTEVSFGRWTQKTKDALVGANGALTDYIDMVKGGTTTDMWSDWLNKQVAAAKADPYSIGNGAGKSPSSSNGFKATSPQDIVMQGDAESQQLLGQSMDGQDQGSLVSAVQGQQQAAFNAGDVYQRSVTPQAVARQYILQNNLPEYTQHQAEGYMNAFANMFLSGQSARANTTVGDAAVATSG